MKIAVVRNRSFDGVISRFGRVCPEKYSEKAVNLVLASLRDAGHEAVVLEADKHLLAHLESWMPSCQDGRPTGLVFNMAYGIQGDCRYTHVPAMLELAGVPYTGSNPLGHALALDKIITKDLLRQAGVPTPNYRTMRSASDSAAGLRFPLIVKPRHESTSFGLHLVQTPAELESAVEDVVSRHAQDALVEEYIDGREFCVALLGNEPVEALPIVEQDFGDREVRLMTLSDKFHKSAVEPRKICPADVDPALAATLNEISIATFRACHCKDYSRVDIRVDSAGNPYVLEINSMASLGAGSSYVMAAAATGYTFAGLINRIVDVAHQRYFGFPAPREQALLQSACAPEGELACANP